MSCKKDTNTQATLKLRLTDGPAMFDAVNSIDGRFTPYLTVAPNAKGASLDAAVAQAAHDTLVKLYPSQAAEPRRRAPG